MRLTLVDVARAAGVSTATVDRVLNSRAGVGARTRDRVLGAAQRLGYADALPAAAPATLGFLVPTGTNSFLDELAHRLAAAGGPAGAAVQVHRVDGFDPDALAEAVLRVAPAVQGLGLVAIDRPAVREAVRRAAAGGTRILTLVSDIGDVPRIGYVGIDNRAAGRLAGQLTARLLPRTPGRVALLAGSLSYRGHEEREMGFHSVLAEEAPHLAVLQLREVQDDVEQGYRAARALLDAHPDLAGLYNIGAGNRGIARALEETGRAREVLFIGHELTDHTKRYLVSGTMDAVIDQNAAAEAALAVERLAAAVRGEPVQPIALLRTQVIFRENIPDS